MSDTKVCRTCGKEKSLDEFHSFGQYKAHDCKRCHGKRMSKLSRERKSKVQRDTELVNDMMRAWR